MTLGENYSLLMGIRKENGGVIVNHNLFLVLTVIFGLTLSGWTIADNAHDPGYRGFIGLWQAIDSFDGSTQYLSITCTPKSSCDVRLNDTAFTLSCQNQIGFAHGEGSIARDVLTVEFTLFCSNLNGASNQAGTQLNKFVLDRLNGTLTNLNDDPVPVPNVFHKISR
jgi:hypothetical protein